MSVLLTFALLSAVVVYGKRALELVQQRSKDAIKDAKVKETLKALEEKKRRAALEEEAAPKKQCPPRSKCATVQPVAAIEPASEDDEASDDASDAKELLDHSDTYSELLLAVGSRKPQRALVDLDDVDSMKQLQRLVLDKWERAGGKRSDGLMMEYTNDNGDFVPVTRSTSVHDVKLAASIKLSPKRKSSSSKSSSGRSTSSHQSYNPVHQDDRVEARVSRKGESVGGTSRSASRGDRNAGEGRRTCD